MQKKLSHLLFDFGIIPKVLLTTDSDRHTPFTTPDNTCSMTMVVLRWEQLWSDAKSN